MINVVLEKIEKDFKEAMKAKETQRLSTLRLLRTALKNKQIELKKTFLEESESLLVIQSQIKQLKDALEAYQQANRKEDEDKTKTEIDILQSYLPKELEEEQLEQLVRSAIEQVQAKDISDLGKAMGAAMKAVQGAADGVRVRKMIQRLLEHNGL